MGVMAGSSVAALIQDAALRDAQSFSARIAGVSLEVAVDTWLRRVVRRRVTPTQRARLVKAVERGSSPETKGIQLTRAALLRAAGLDERAAAAAAIAAGATFTEVGAILGMTQQGASARIGPYVSGRATTSGPRG